jgi:ubiquinone biosynthesis protein COQ9
MAALIDLTTPKGRVIAAAFRLAETRPWGDITLLDIADAANVRLTDLKAVTSTKSDLIAAFMTAVDDAVVQAAPKRDATQPVRDRLFEVIMGRFDLLAPYKVALQSMTAATRFDPQLIQPFYASQHWMLQAAGVDTEGAHGAVRMLGLGSLYAAVFQVWLADEDPGMAATMAALDRRLRRGEQTLTTIDDACSGVMRFASNLPGLVGSVFKRGTKGTAHADPETPPPTYDVPTPGA